MAAGAASQALAASGGRSVAPAIAAPPVMRLPLHVAWGRSIATVITTTTRSSPQPAPSVVFPHGARVDLDGRAVPVAQVCDLLAPSLSPERVQRMEAVVKARCYGVVPVVEGLYDMGNLAAVCRSADAMGFGAVHCISRPEAKYKRSQRTAAGADRWLDTRLWGDTAECLAQLKAAGYQVVATHLSASSLTIQEVDWTRPTAFVLGNEKRGVSDTAVQLADHTAIIPMHGYVESFNISVAAALILYEARQQRARAAAAAGGRARGAAGDLPPEQQQQLLASFMLRGLKNSSLLVSELLNRPPPAHQAKFFRGQAALANAAAAGSAVEALEQQSQPQQQQSQAQQQQQQQQQQQGCKQAGAAPDA